MSLDKSYLGKAQPSEGKEIVQVYSIKYVRVLVENERLSLSDAHVPRHISGPKSAGRD